MEFYDAHAHRLEAQSGGFLIGLEGEPRFEGILNNKEVSALEDVSKLLFAVLYIGRDFGGAQGKILKYHPRREGYSPGQVAADIRKRKPRIVVIDTLNQPFWQPIDYWRIASNLKEVQFLFSHAGGYDINEFLKIAHFQSNVWIDFAMTQEYFGWCGSKARYENVANAIEFALNNSDLKQKVLFGSDNGFFSQPLALKKYASLKDNDLFLRNNFLKLVEKAKI